MQGEGTVDDIASKDREDVLSKDVQVRDEGQSKAPTVSKLVVRKDCKL